MQDLTLTRTFEEHWLKRVGNWPTPEAVSNFVENSVKVQRCEDLVRADGRPFRMLAIYWNPDLDLIIKVDDAEGRAVTVINRRNWQAEKLTQQRRSAQVLPKNAAGSAARPKGQKHGFADKLAARIARVRERFGLRAASI
ncbi:MAG: hypothetical protein JXL84_15020 [Deltaproteobacteria bacterium]|nr:hypothetical protein [Deltaproteobacteria bacterium]